MGKVDDDALERTIEKAGLSEETAAKLRAANAPDAAAVAADQKGHGAPAPDIGPRGHSLY